MTQPLLQRSNAIDAQAFSPSPANELRRVWRAFRVVVHLCYGLLLALCLFAFWRPYSPVVRRAAQHWQKRLLHILSVDVEVIGRADAGARFLVSNHVSWLDIPVIGAQRNVHFLSKAEVRKWPLIGQLSVAAGTLFIRRGAGESRQKSHEVAKHLQRGRTILVFPEGTTTDGTGLRRFFPQLFNAPLIATSRVQPVALQYLDARGRVDTQPAFIGDDAFHHHLWALLRRDVIRVRVCFLPSLDVATTEQDAAEALCRESREAIARVLAD
ncbi:MAG: lysophospholipid acyltransferase family protein [Alcanivoracaceae bacterium]|nr:lysophospholipid acyltransferase family protein [Alcanivoracaceae bacterium]